MPVNKLDFSLSHDLGERIRFESVGFQLISKYLSESIDFKPGILDIAPADHNIIQFCASCNGIYYSSSNLLEKILKLNEQKHEGNSETVIASMFREQLKSLDRRKHIQPLDAILVWDLFNYLHRENVIKLMALLSPMCKKGTLLYSLLWLSERMPSEPGGFTLALPNSVEYRFNSIDMIPAPSLTAQSIVSMMPSFKQNRMLVSETGILEVLLEFDELVAPPNPKVLPAVRLTGAFQ